MYTQPELNLWSSLSGSLADLPDLQSESLLTFPLVFPPLSTSVLNYSSFFHCNFLLRLIPPFFLCTFLLFLSYFLSLHTLCTRTSLPSLPSTLSCHRRPDQWRRWSGWIWGSGFVRRSGGGRLWLVKRFLHFSVRLHNPPGAPGRVGWPCPGQNCGAPGGGGRQRRGRRRRWRTGQKERNER